MMFNSLETKKYKLCFKIDRGFYNTPSWPKKNNNFPRKKLLPKL